MVSVSGVSFIRSSWSATVHWYVGRWRWEQNIYEKKTQEKWYDQKKKSLSNDVKLELEWQIKQHLTFFFDNTTVLGPDFQTDIKFVPDWWNAFMIHYLSSNWICSAPSSADNKGAGEKCLRFLNCRDENVQICIWDAHCNRRRNTCFMKHLIISVEDNFSHICFCIISLIGLWMHTSVSVRRSLTLNEYCGDSFIKAVWHKFMLAIKWELWKNDLSASFFEN